MRTPFLTKHLNNYSLKMIYMTAHNEKEALTLKLYVTDDGSSLSSSC